MRSLHRHPTIPYILAGLLAIMMVFASAWSAPAAMAKDQTTAHVVSVEAHNNTATTRFWFVMPTHIPTGWVEFRFHNEGTVAHEAQFFRLLDPNFTEADLIKALASNGPPPQGNPPFEAAGGAATSIPGGSQDVLQWIKPGHYVVVCFESGGGNGSPHFLQGMHKSFFAITGTRAPIDHTDAFRNGTPVSSGTVILKDFHIQVPEVMTDRRFQVIKVENHGPQTHQMQIIKIPAGTTRQDILKAIKAGGPSFPTVLAGGMDALAPHSTAWVELHLHTGTYVAICFVPDDTTGLPHAALGMFTIFVVK